MRVLWCTSHCQTRALTLISCSKPLSCTRTDCFPVKGNRAAPTACALEGNHTPTYPFQTHRLPHQSVVRTEQTNKHNPCSKSTSFLLSSCPSFHPPGHRNALQAASAKYVPLPNNKLEKPGGAWTTGGTLTGAMPCTEICKTNYCISKPSQTKYTFPQKHPNKALSTIEIIKNSIF